MERLYLENSHFVNRSALPWKKKEKLCSRERWEGLRTPLDPLGIPILPQNLDESCSMLQPAASTLSPANSRRASEEENESPGGRSTRPPLLSRVAMSPPPVPVSAAAAAPPPPPPPNPVVAPACTCAANHDIPHKTRRPSKIPFAFIPRLILQPSSNQRTRFWHLTPMQMRREAHGPPV